ncbi:MAG: PAS domain S-box protein [Alphaproteobacteria bacterium]
MTTHDYISRSATQLWPGEKSASVCVREFDAEWNITHVNKAHCVLFNCEAHDLVGRKPWSFMDGKFAQDEQKQFLTLLLKDRKRSAPFFCTERLSDGSLLPLRVDWCYRRDHDGEVVGFIWWLERLDASTDRQMVPGGQPYEALLDLLHDGVGLVHRNGSFTYVNKRLCEILGVNKQALIGHSVFSLGDKPGKQALALARAAGEQGEIDRCEVTHRHPNGKRICLSVSGRSVQSQIGPMDPGQDVTSLMIVSDVTDRWRAETMRRRQAQIFDEIHDAVLILNGERVVVDCNASAEWLFGYEKRELIGKPAYALRSPRARPQDPEIAAAFLEHGRWVGEVQISRPVGSDRICEVSVGPFRDDDGQVIGYISVSRDISARKATERALRDSEERYRQLVEMQSDALIVHDQADEIFFTNDAAAEFYRAKSVASLRQKSWLDLLPTEKRRAAANQAEAICNRGYNPPSYESSHRRLDGSHVAVEMSARRVCWDGRPAVMSIVRDITDRKQAEDALRESEARFRNLVGLSIQGYAIISADWTLLFCNDAMARMFGYAGAGEMVSAGVAKSFFADQHLERASKVAEIVLNGQGPCNIEIKCCRKDGHSIWLSAAIGLVDWEGVPAIQAAVVDITLRKEAEIALQASESMLRLVTDTLPGLVSYIGRDGRYQFNNRVYEDWFGIPCEQLRGTHLRDLLGESEYRRVRPWLDRSFAGRTMTFETRTLSAARRTISGTFVPDFDETGAVRGVVGYVTDVSKSRSAEDDLRLQAALLENLAEGVGMVRPRDGLIIYANPKLEQMFGYAQGDFLGAGQLVQRGEIRQFAPIIAALKGSGSWTGEIECRAKSGMLAWCRGIFTTFDHLEHGVVWVGVFADIAEQKQAHEDLRLAKEEAVRANMAKSRFLASASHDLRQPLHASNLFLAALPDARNEKERNQIIGDLGTALLSMGSLLHDLLEISKLEAQVVRPEITDIYLRGLMTQLATEFGALASQKGIELRVVTSGVTVRTDLTLLGRILGNFLANAVQHTDRGKILFGCRRVGDHIRIAVWDTGIGVPTEVQDMIFEEFYQHRAPSGAQSPGLGLGLAIVKRTANLLGHRIVMASEFGKGAMFAVDVPVGSVEGQAVEAIRWSMAVNGDVAGASMVVLEDDPSVRKATEQILKVWGVSVIAVDTSDAAVGEINQAGVRPDLLIADYQLTDETGLTAARRIRDVCGYDIPTIIITANLTPERLVEITQTGATAMSKPVKPAELRLAIRDLSRRRS